MTDSGLCLRCGTGLFGSLSKETGICPDCWTPADEDEELDSFIDATLNKDGPNSHPDDMFSMGNSEDWKLF